MKYITSFFMAWGTFLAIPCPVKKWDKKYIFLRLGFLPAVGLILGLIYALILYALYSIWNNFIPTGNPQQLLYAIILLFSFTFPFLASGGFHLDGFMDCSDAIFSRKPLVQRQEILKDSHVGAFAVIHLAMLMIMYLVVHVTLVTRVDLTLLPLVFVSSRAFGGLWVTCYKAGDTSQYSGGEEKEIGKARSEARKVLILLTIFILAIYVAVRGFFILQYSYTDEIISQLIPVGTTFIAVGISSFLSCAFCRHNLKMMNGDIAGYTICISELVGLAALILFMGA